MDAAVVASDRSGDYAYRETAALRGLGFQVAFQLALHTRDVGSLSSPTGGGPVYTYSTRSLTSSRSARTRASFVPRVIDRRRALSSVYHLSRIIRFSRCREFRDLSEIKKREDSAVKIPRRCGGEIALLALRIHVQRKKQRQHSEKISRIPPLLAYISYSRYEFFFLRSIFFQFVRL